MEHETGETQRRRTPSQLGNRRPVASPDARVGTGQPSRQARAQSAAAPKPPKPPKRYVGDYGNEIRGAGTVATVTFGMVVLALAIGFVIGFLVWAALWTSSALTSVVWMGVNEGNAPWFMPIILCTVGGLLIGLWSKYMGGDPEKLEDVMAAIKRDGTYKLKSIPASTVGFLLPLAFGGSVGLEAGLTGLIAAAVCWIGDTLKRAGLKVKSVADLTISASLTAIFGAPFAGIVAAVDQAMPDQNDDDGKSATRPDVRDYTFRRRGKLVLYTAAAFGAIGGIRLLTLLVGGLTGMPRFDVIQAQPLDWVWFIPCLAAAYLMTLLYFASEKACTAVGGNLERFTVLRPLVCGLAIGVIAVFLPNTLFCGEEQAFELMDTWQLAGAGILLATGFVKVFCTSFCLNMGWRGGNFFPNIYAGISCGYGIALLAGADPVFCVTVTVSAYLAGMMRKPLLPIALLILCFPMSGIFWMGLACVLGAALPVPKVLLPASEEA